MTALPFNADTIFHSEIYFINQAVHREIKWGTDSKVRLFDPGSGLHLEIGASGTFSLKVTDSRRLVLQLVGTENGLKADLFSENLFLKAEARDIPRDSSAD